MLISVYALVSPSKLAILLPIKQNLVLKCCRLYNVFSSGAAHGIYAQFISQTSMANSGKKIGLLRGAGTRMATWFYAMVRVLRLQQPLLATIHQAKFCTLDLNQRTGLAVRDIENKVFFKALYTLVRAVFPALRALRYCDSNTPAMDKIFHLSHRTTMAIEKSIASLNDVDLFGAFSDEDESLNAEASEIFGEEVNNRYANLIDSVQLICHMHSLTFFLILFIFVKGNRWRGRRQHVRQAK